MSCIPLGGCKSSLCANMARDESCHSFTSSYVDLNQSSSGGIISGYTCPGTRSVGRRRPGCSQKHHTVNAGFAVVIFILEQCVHAQVLCVTKNHLHVGRRPGDSLRFAEPTDGGPKVNSFLHVTFLGFIPRHLQNKIK